MKATLVFKLSEEGRFAAAEAGLPRERCAALQAIPDVTVPVEWWSHVYVDPAGRAWISLV